MVFYIRSVKKSDIDDIFLIEKESFKTPWNKNAFLCELSKNYESRNIFLVAVLKETEKVIGYIIGDKIVDFANILNITVEKNHRKEGIGFALLNAFEKECIKNGLNAMTLEVRASNENAINLYKKFGFIIQGKREKYYENSEDALLMWKRF
jgi:ribosomal-protein-alanine N-acetyltransferase